MSTQFNCQKHYNFKLFSLFKQLYITIQFSISTVSMSNTDQFQRIQFSISTQFKYMYGLVVNNIFISSYSVIQFTQTIQFSISIPLVLFNPLIGPYQVLPRRARVDLGAMAIKGYSAFPKARALLEPHHQII